MDANVLIFDAFEKKSAWVPLRGQPWTAVSRRCGPFWTPRHHPDRRPGPVPVRNRPHPGFAVTLSIGIVASLFTAIFVSRLIFDYLLVKVKMKSISV